MSDLVGNHIVGFLTRRLINWYLVCLPNLGKECFFFFIFFFFYFFIYLFFVIIIILNSYRIMPGLTS